MYDKSSIFNRKRGKKKKKAKERMKKLSPCQRG